MGRKALLNRVEEELLRVCGIWVDNCESPMGQGDVAGRWRRKAGAYWG